MRTMSEAELPIEALLAPVIPEAEDYGNCAPCPIVCNSLDIIAIHSEKMATLTDDIASGKVEMAVMQMRSDITRVNNEGATYEEELTTRLKNYARILDQSEKSIAANQAEIEKVRRMCPGVLSAIARREQLDGSTLEVRFVACGSPTITPHDTTTGQAEKISVERSVVEEENN
jgi:hypothetical protein